MNPEQLRIHAERIRASLVLGRSDLMQRLFDFLVECSLAGRAPKEIEIAIDVFGKDAQFEVARDAMVRVYMHKLRRKLDDFYSDPGRDKHGRAEHGRLTIPRGEYRLVFEVDTSFPTEQSNASEPVSEEAVDALMAPTPLDEQPIPLPIVEENSRFNRRTLWVAGAVAATLIVLLAANLFVLWKNETPMARQVTATRHHALWSGIVNDNLPVYIVMGDYYIFGELDDNANAEPESVRRLVREFNINSRNDLEQLIKERPALDRRYMDLALRYLPVSAANALHSIIPLLEPNAKNPRQVQVILASDLTPSMIRSSHIVYIGLTSGMGVLQDIALSGSRFKFGETYDELIDREKNQTYVSQSSVSVNNTTRYRDYGYFSTFSGPNRNRIVILAGTRDVALMHTAEAVSRDESLTALEQRAGGVPDFEALYAVDGIDRMNLDGQLLLANRIDTQRIWPGESQSVAKAADVGAQTELQSRR